MKKVKAIDIIILIFSLILCLGCAFVFGACGPKEDGSWMVCHWAEKAVIMLGALCSILALLKVVCANDGVRLGLAAAIFCNSLAAVFVPGRIFSLCKIAQMRCHLIMKPAVFTVGILLCVLCLFDALLLFKKVYSKENA